MIVLLNISRSPLDCRMQLVGMNHPMSCWPVVWSRSSSVTRPPADNSLGDSYHKLHSAVLQSKAPDDGQNCCPKHVELIWIY